MKLLQARIGGLWCDLMHSAPMWPSHGHYECRTCGRLHPVGWERPWRFRSRAVVVRRETQPHTALIPATESTI